MKPYGWYCELVHDASGEVVNTGFWRDAPIEGPHDRMKGYTWRATALYTAALSQTMQPQAARAVVTEAKPFGFVRQFDIDNFPDSNLLMSKKADDEWQVPVYLAAPGAAIAAREQEGAESYESIWNALQRIDSAAAMLPTYSVRHAGGIEAFTQNIIDALTQPTTVQQAALQEAARETIKWLNSYFRFHDGNKYADKLSAALKGEQPEPSGSERGNAA